MSTGNLVIILGDQLSFDISSLQGFDKSLDQILMMEVMEEASYVSHHKHKLILIFSAMRHFAHSLKQQDYKVHYIPLEYSQGNFIDTLLCFAKQHTYSHIILTEPSEYRVLEAFSSSAIKPLNIQIREDDRFFCSKEFFKQHAKAHPNLRMEYFYREMRRKTGILMEGDKPVGGKWNYDSANRKPYDNKVPFPTYPKPKKDNITQSVMDMVDKRFANNMGTSDTFHWAVTRKEALRQLQFFMEKGLQHFGVYQDAMVSHEHRLFHSLLSAYLNIGLLSPKEIIQKVLEAYQNNTKITIESTEGLIRQILGWREYVRGIYWLKMPEYKEKNYLEAHNPLPDFYWNAKTDMACMNHAIQNTIDYAYSHHIQRLMITGNFALLAGLDIKQVCHWYLAVYADAFEWVELPNTLGMACYADEGLFASKPYAASGNYINKMSNFCKKCCFDVTDKTGEKSCPFNALYWRFMIRNEEKLSDNPRLKYPYATLHKMSEENKNKLIKRAEAFLQEILPKS